MRKLEVHGWLGWVGSTVGLGWVLFLFEYVCFIRAFRKGKDGIGIIFLREVLCLVFVG